jgi:DNA-binding GntR family transcriptional regulator
MSVSSLQPIRVQKTPRFREAAYAAIKEAILSGQLTPHQALVEEQLAAMLQISRTPVREALAILEHEGLIGPRGGRGLYVCMISRETFVEMFVANEAVEPYLVRQAALHATDDLIGALHETIDRARTSTTDHDLAGFLRASRDFHRLVGVASGNTVLTQFVVRNEERADMYLLSEGKQINPRNMDASTEEHAAILNAIQGRDPETAARLAIYHAQSLRVRLGDLFRQKGEQRNGRRSSAS